jgi:hypothetical protein
MDLPREVRLLQVLDADLAEALWVLDQPKGGVDLKAMERDTLASLERIPRARERLFDLLTEEERETVLASVAAVRDRLTPEEAYLDVPGRDPMAG